MQLQILVNFGLGGRTMILADKIIEERKKNGWTQEELAQKLGVSRQSVSKWESAGAIPDLKKIIQFADKELDITIGSREQLKDPEAQEAYVDAYNNQWEGYDLKI